MLSLHNVSIRYGDFSAVQDFSLSLEIGEIACLLGPSGSGKTSLLRCIAGFETPSQGSIELRGQLVANCQNSVAPEKRGVAVVFQDYALFPHLNVKDNVVFGIRHLPKSVQLERCQQLLALVGLDGTESRFIQSLSGGQQQRVAIARALATEPDILLLDEPFSNLDAELRSSLAVQLRSILKQAGVTALMVTHDQSEAFTVCDTVALMEQGKLQQHGSPESLYQSPANLFVARFVGQFNVLPVASMDPSSQSKPAVDSGLKSRLVQDEITQKGGIMAFSPHAISLSSSMVNGSVDSVSFEMTIKSMVFRGGFTEYTLGDLEGRALRCVLSGSPDWHQGEQVVATICRKAILSFGDDGYRLK